jgi:hypothetical protein
MNFHEHEKTGKPGRSFQSAAVEHTGVKIGGARGDDWFTHHNRPEFITRMQRATENNGVKQGGDWFGPGTDCSAPRWCSSRSAARKHASALIAKIPFPLARHIARCYRPEVAA